MTAKIIICCDGPSSLGRCRAFLPTHTYEVDEADEEALRNGWTVAPDGTDRCPAHRGVGSPDPRP